MTSGEAKHITAVFPALQCTVSTVLFELVPVVPATPFYAAHTRMESLRSNPLCGSAVGQHQRKMVARGLSPLANLLLESAPLHSRRQLKLGMAGMCTAGRRDDKRRCRVLSAGTIP